MSFKNWDLDVLAAKQLFVDAFHDDNEGVRLIVSDALRSKLYRFRFSYPLAYRFTQDIAFKHTENETCPDNSTNFLIARNSEWIKVFKDSCGGIYDDHEILHYLIYTEDGYTEFLSLEPPIIEDLRSAE